MRMLRNMRNRGVSEYFFRLGMTDEMRRQIEDWRAENQDPETGKVPSFAEACRQLIAAGLAANVRKSRNKST